MTCRALILGSGGMIVGALLAFNGMAVAGEQKEAVTRPDLIATVEQGPGPSRGLPDAPVVVVEFSDFQCVYCRKFWKETLPKLDERYIRPGKVRFVYRHLAILGEASVLAAQAASCAHDQGKFWEYHDTLFGNRSPLIFTSARLKRYAGELGLEEKSFAACLDSKRHGQRVEAETIIGRALGASGTPAFLINGQLLIGAYPFEVFQQAVDGLLAAPRGQPPGRSK